MNFSSIQSQLSRWQIQLVLLLIFCFCACFATGYGFNHVDALRDVWVGTLGTFALLLSVATLSPRWARVILQIFVITSILYFPVGWLYGSPTFKIVGGALEADGAEVGEFLGFVPKYVWLLHVAYALLGVWVGRGVGNLFHKVKKLSKKWQRYMQAAAATALFTPILANYVTEAGFQDDEATIPVMIVGFYADLIAAPYIYWDKKAELLEQAKQPSTWHIQSVQPKYQNHVLVVGESARKDYLHAYGFPLENTPFLSKSNGLLIDGYISTAEFTMHSLPQTLSLPSQSHNNVISLAKQAGFQTAWLSNQGMLGFFSSEVSSYATRSDHAYFTQRGDYQKSLGMSDRMLLPQLEKVLAKPSISPKLVVLHIMGSHHDFCKRLDNGVQFDYKSEKMSCYVSSIKETDDLLRDIVEILKKQGQSYSLVYFSDHGLKHTGMGDALTLTHGGDTYQSFEVPLVKISSDDTEHKIIQTQRSAFNFLKGFGQWTGIHAQELQQEGYDFWGSQADVPEKGNNLQQVNAMQRDSIQ